MINTGGNPDPESRVAQARRALQEIHFQSAFDDAAIGMALVAPDGRWLHVNRAFQELTGYDTPALLSKTFQDITHPDDLERDLELVRQVLAGTIRTYQMEKRYLHADGHVIWVLLNVSLVRGANGEPLHFIAQIQDITRAKEAVEAAEAANIAKSRFLSRMSHELRTPLNSVLGFTRLVADGAVGATTPEQREYLEIVYRNGQRLLCLVNEVLDLARVEGGSVSLTLELVALDQIIRDVVAQLNGRTVSRPLELLVELPELIAPVLTDRVLLRQVLLNLLDNALKFTEHGTVMVRVQADPASGVVRRVEIADTGPGIAADRIDAIFAAFEQANSQVAARHGGAGLGLTISRSLCELMGFGLHAESTEGQGATFVITLPGSASKAP